MTDQPTVGFIGIGKMGWPMASRLAPHYDLIVSDASDQQVDAFLGAFKARRAADNAALARESDIVVLMLPTSAIVEQVMAGPTGVRAGLRAGTIVVDMGSSVPGATRVLSEALAGQGVTLVDAPVSGGVPKAEAGTLAIMAGGPTEAIDAVSPILGRLGAKVLRTGEVGSAHAMKALNNLASAAGLLIGVEVLSIGAKFGLDPALMVDVLNASSGMTDATQRKLKPFVLSRRFDAGFGMDLMVKDVGIALELAREAGASASLASRCGELWASAQRELGPGRDHTEIARYIEALSGVELRE
jgi:3-hydroxyisobutyrate dehydrogenase